MRRQVSENEVGITLEAIQRLYRRQARVSLYKLIHKTHPAVMAATFRHLENTERLDIFQYILRMEGFQEFLDELDEALIEELMESLSPEEIEKLISNFPPEDIADILDRLPQETAAKVRKLLDKEDRKEVDAIRQYDEDSAGGIMSTQFIRFHEDLKVSQAIAKFQDLDENTDAPFYIYVINDKEQLVGVLSLRQLLLHPPNTKLSDIMESDYIAVSPETDQEEVANLVSRYNYLAVPVIDSDHILVGVITVDDVIDVLREEATEDILKMAGAGDDREILLKSTFENARTRFPWLLASWGGGVAALAIIGAFESMLEKTIILAAFIPIIMGMGGNIGTQTSTIIVRGIATGRVNMAEVAKVIFKEIRVGMLLGVVYGMLLGILTYFRYLSFVSPVWLGVVVGLSVFCAMTIAVSIGSIFPILLNKMDIDPAISTGPFVTTSIDIFGVLIYFYIASSLLNL